MDLSFLPTVNAGLNGVAALLLVVGLVLIKKNRVAAHRRCMLAATGVSGLFLISYVTHYAWRAAVKGGAHTVYHGEGWLRGFYYAVLLSHVLLAMAVPFLAVRLIWLGLGGRIDKHRRLARVGWPVWMYVSVTGVVIYLMLYRFNPVA